MTRSTTKLPTNNYGPTNMNEALQKFLDFILRRTVAHVVSDFTKLELKLQAAADRQAAIAESARIAAAKAAAAEKAAVAERERACRIAVRVKALVD